MLNDKLISNNFQLKLMVFKIGFLALLSHSFIVLYKIKATIENWRRLSSYFDITDLIELARLWWQSDTNKSLELSSSNNEKNKAQNA